MIVATWNVNSVRARLEHLSDWLAEAAPDILGVQETKAQDADFPSEHFTKLGYHTAFVGQKSYNGVAIISRQPARKLCSALAGAEEHGARYISATFDDGAGGELRFVNVYVINGKEVGHEAYNSKLAFLDLLGQQASREAQDCSGALCVVGDFNVAPADLDVYDPEEWHEKILCSSPERASFEALLSQTATHDTLRELNPKDPQYTWWDYRGFRYRRKQGMRIDHILLSAPLRERCQRAWVDESPRKQERPSDHTPALAEL